ncbi:MAG: putative toxin-antitoxin system toxin component, PIN family [Oscillospiraceae bacterium]|nr:putative toxin-antitoxin system toxin component, PIN family [Oscillospiraceae bacterium]
MLVVVDTNVFVSAFWSKKGNPAKILSLIQNRLITPCYDYRILTEYLEILSRKKFGFDSWEINDIISQIKHDGMSVVAKPMDIPFVDLSDKKFYEVAKHCNAVLITGNLRHFPMDGTVVSPAEFLEKFDFRFV